MNTNNFRLVGKIKGLSMEILHLKKRPIKNKYLEGYLSSQWWNQKVNLALKTDVRHHLLAYAFIKNLKSRALPYTKVEQKCEIKPSTKEIVQILLNHNFLQVASKNWKGEPCVIVKQFNEENFGIEVTKWLNGEV